jgi:hypothetical protein
MHGIVQKYFIDHSGKGRIVLRTRVSYISFTVIHNNTYCDRPAALAC